MIAGHDRPTGQQLRVLAAWHDTLVVDLGVVFLGVTEIGPMPHRDTVCCIGHDEDVPGCSWLELRRFGAYPATADSGGSSWTDTVVLHDGRDADGRPLDLRLESAMLDDVGWWWGVTSAAGDEHLVQRSSDGFARRFDATAEVRADWRWMLPADER